MPPPFETNSAVHPNLHLRSDVSTASCHSAFHVRGKGIFPAQLPWRVSRKWAAGRSRSFLPRGGFAKSIPQLSRARTSKINSREQSSLPLLLRFPLRDFQISFADALQAWPFSYAVHPMLGVLRALRTVGGDGDSVAGVVLSHGFSPAINWRSGTQGKLQQFPRASSP